MRIKIDKKLIIKIMVILFMPVIVGIFGPSMHMIWFKVKLFDPELPPFGIRFLDWSTLILSFASTFALGLRSIAGKLFFRLPISFGLGIWAFLRTGSISVVFIGYFAYCCCCDTAYQWNDLVKVILNPLKPFI